MDHIFFIRPTDGHTLKILLMDRLIDGHTLQFLLMSLFSSVLPMEIYLKSYPCIIFFNSFYRSTYIQNPTDGSFFFFHLSYQWTLIKNPTNRLSFFRSAYRQTYIQNSTNGSSFFICPIDRHILKIVQMDHHLHLFYQRHAFLS